VSKLQLRHECSLLLSILHAAWAVKSNHCKSLTNCLLPAPPCAVPPQQLQQGVEPLQLVLRRSGCKLVLPQEATAAQLGALQGRTVLLLTCPPGICIACDAAAAQGMQRFTSSFLRAAQQLQQQAGSVVFEQLLHTPETFESWHQQQLEQGCSCSVLLDLSQPGTELQAEARWGPPERRLGEAEQLGGRGLQEEGQEREAEGGVLGEEKEEEGEQKEGAAKGGWLDCCRQAAQQLPAARQLITSKARPLPLGCQQLTVLHPPPRIAAGPAAAGAAAAEPSPPADYQSALAGAISSSAASTNAARSGSGSSSARYTPGPPLRARDLLRAALPANLRDQAAVADYLRRVHVPLLEHEGIHVEETLVGRWA
jgi:hypothetical protein